MDDHLKCHPTKSTAHPADQRAFVVLVVEWLFERRDVLELAQVEHHAAFVVLDGRHVHQQPDLGLWKGNKT